MAHIPYGYRIINGKAVIDEAQRDKLTALFQYFVGGATIRGACLMADTGRTPRSCGLMLVNRTYLGTSFYPRLIEEALFDKAQEEMGRRRAGRTGRGGRRKRIPVSVQTRFAYEGSDPAVPDAVLIYERIRGNGSQNNQSDKTDQDDAGKTRERAQAGF